MDDKPRSSASSSRSPSPHDDYEAAPPFGDVPPVTRHTTHRSHRSARSGRSNYSLAVGTFPTDASVYQSDDDVCDEEEVDEERSELNEGVRPADVEHNAELRKETSHLSRAADPFLVVLPSPSILSIER